jgi:hypothetical protein
VPDEVRSRMGPRAKLDSRVGARGSHPQCTKRLSARIDADTVPEVTNNWPATSRCIAARGDPRHEVSIAFFGRYHSAPLSQPSPWRVRLPRIPVLQAINTKSATCAGNLTTNNQYGT